MHIVFLHPFFLLLLPAVVLLWFFPHRPHDRAQAILRSVLVASAIAAIARPVLFAANGEVFQVLIVDASDSIAERPRIQAERLVGQWLAQIGDRSRSSVIVMEGEARKSSDPSTRHVDRAGSVIHIGSSRSTSSLSAALAAAARQIPLHGRGTITLLSDGLSTDQRWAETVQSVIRRGITVNTARLRRDERDVYLSGVSTDPVMRVGQTIEVRVHVVGQTALARVRLRDDTGMQLAMSAPFASSTETTVPLTFEPRSTGFMTVRAELVDAAGDSSPAGDSNPANNAVQSTLAIQSPLRLLYVGERMRYAASRLAQLMGRGVQIDDGSDRDLSKPFDPGRYDAVMIDDRSAARLPPSFQESVSTAVHERGMGLLFSGGKASFGAGGYEGTALAGLLPVELSQRTEKRDPSVALAVVIDTSGSMSGSRMELAKQVARLAIRRLNAHDRVGIVEFYGNKQWALPMQPAANAIAIDRALGRMQATGGTVLYPAIEEAWYGLKNVTTRYKHILIITDAGIEEADFESLVRRIARDRINVSTVLAGAQAHAQSLIDIASWGKGRFYAASDLYSLPEVILKQPSTSRLPEYRSGAFEVSARGEQGWWADIDRGRVPELRGYVETEARPGAQVLLEVADGKFPVLATWHYGLGRVTALMTEPVGAGTASWRAWKDYGLLLARLVERTAAPQQPFRFDIHRDDRRVTVTASRRGGSHSELPQAHVLDDHGNEAAALSFRRLTPDYFVAELAVDPAAQLRVSASTQEAGANTALQPRVMLVSDAAEDVAAEFQVDPGHGLDLEALARATSGLSIDPANASVDFNSKPVAGRGALTLYNLWRYVVLLALLIYIAEIVYRRRTRLVYRVSSVLP